MPTSTSNSIRYGGVSLKKRGELRGICCGCARVAATAIAGMEQCSVLRRRDALETGYQNWFYN